MNNAPAIEEKPDREPVVPPTADAKPPIPPLAFPTAVATPPTASVAVLLPPTNFPSHPLIVPRASTKLLTPLTAPPMPFPNKDKPATHPAVFKVVSTISGSNFEIFSAKSLTTSVTFSIIGVAPSPKIVNAFFSSFNDFFNLNCPVSAIFLYASSHFPALLLISSSVSLKYLPS